MAWRGGQHEEESTVVGVLSKPNKQRVTVYDAVAGRVTEAGLIGHVKDPKASNKSLRPDEVLFKQKNAPIRYEETDYYPAHTRLPAAQQLPSGDLSGTLHAYISKLYSATEQPGMQRGWKSMDETALIALGILMEETARGVLGETGDLAFTEAAEKDEEEALARANKWSMSAGKMAAPVGDEKQSTRRGKKRAVAKEEQQMDGEMGRIWFASEDESQHISDEFD